MKICFLADAQSVHTQRWVRSIVERGIDVLVISFRDAKIDKIPVYTLKTPKIFNINPSTPLWLRFHYFFGVSQAKKLIDEFQPDILHAFWGTSYGFLGARLKFHNFVVSVWGQDITKSPRESIIMKLIVRYVLDKAIYIYCTSKYLIDQTKIYIKNDSKIRHIPFGIDGNYFIKEKISNKVITIGTTKSLEKYYGIDILIKAFSRIVKDYPNIKLKLVGDGTYKNKLIQLIEDFNINDKCVIIPAVDCLEIPSILSTFDIYVLPSIAPESFGVAALEASASGLPVIASNIGGIPEIIIDKVTGILVAPNSVEKLAGALLELIKSRDLRQKYGNAGRTFVKENYQWNINVQMQIREYKKLLN